MRRLRIGIDIDGVIVDYVTASLPLLSEICGRPISYQEFYSRNVGEVLNIDKKEETYFWEQVFFTDLLRFAPPIEGAIEGLNLLYNHDVWLITGRPSSMRNLSLSWLKENYINYDNIVFDSNKTAGKLLVERECDVFIEDQLEVASAIAEEGVFTILLDQPWNQTSNLPNNCIRVHDWTAIISQINKFGG